ncbi:MAG: S8 family serine peptidase, partial [Actinomycetota bacterium]|nr:S8 family serine peptidase [Actinomycetota bacterium]
MATCLAAALLSAGLVSLAGPAAAATYDPSADMDSMLNTTAYSGAQAYWQAGFTGKGVDVALIDTGVTPVEGLAGPGKVVNGPDLSFESQSKSLQYLDTNGHGTFMAGLIAGQDSNVTDAYGKVKTSYLGMAPDARIVNVKVGSADGAVDVSQVIAAIDWVVEHKNDNGMDIRVLTLAYGTNSGQDYQEDPLAFAVERAWNAGIFVVAAAGNEGYVGDGASMANPAKDPFVLAVGASQSNGTATLKDDDVAPFSAVGSKKRHVDLVAPGTHLQGLRVPGSNIDLAHPEGRIDDRFFRGSGTSEAAAIASGAAALVIQQRPSIKPGQLKLLLMRSGVRVDRNNIWQGMGEINLQTALTADSSETDSFHVPSTGTGSLEYARGSQHVVLDGVVLKGEQDIFGHPFDAAAMAATKVRWTGGEWNGSTWSGNSWSGNTWSGNT